MVFVADDMCQNLYYANKTKEDERYRHVIFFDDDKKDNKVPVLNSKNAQNILKSTFPALMGCGYRAAVIFC